MKCITSCLFFHLSNSQTSAFNDFSSSRGLINAVLQLEVPSFYYISSGSKRLDFDESKKYLPSFQNRYEGAAIFHCARSGHPATTFRQAGSRTDSYSKIPPFSNNKKAIGSIISREHFPTGRSYIKIRTFFRTCHSIEIMRVP